MSKTPEIIDRGLSYTKPDTFGKPRSHFYATNSMLNYQYGGPILNSVKHVFGNGGFKPMVKNIPSPYQFAGTKIYRDTTEIPNYRQGGNLEQPWLNNLYADGGGLFDRFREWKEKNVDQAIADAEPVEGVQQLMEVEASGNEAKKKLHISLMDKARALGRTVAGRKVWMEDGPRNWTFDELQRYINKVNDYNQQAQRYERDKRLVEKGELDTDTYARRYNEGNWARFDQATKKESFKGQYQNAVDEGMARKEKNFAVTQGLAELTGVPAAMRIVSDPVGTLKGVGTSLADLAMLPYAAWQAKDWADNTLNMNGLWNLSKNPITGQDFGAGFNKTMDVVSVLPILNLAKPAVKAVTSELNFMNSINKVPSSKVLLQSAEQRLGNPKAYNLLQGKETGLRGKIANKYYANVQKNIEKEADIILTKSLQARRNGDLELANNLYQNEYIPKLQEVKAIDNKLLDWRRQYSGLPIENTGMGGGEGRIYSLTGDPNQVVKVGHSFNTEDELAKLIEVGQNFQMPGSQFAFPTRYVPLGGKQFAQFMPKLNYQGFLPVGKTTDDLAAVAQNLNQQGVGIDYAGVGNYGRVGDDMGFVDLTYIGKPGQRTSAYDWSMFHPDKSGYRFKLQENLGTEAQQIADNAAGLLNGVTSDVAPTLPVESTGLRQGGPFQTSYYSSDVNDNYYAEGGFFSKKKDKNTTGLLATDIMQGTPGNPLITPILPNNEAFPLPIGSSINTEPTIKLDPNAVIDSFPTPTIKPYVYPAGDYADQAWAVQQQIFPQSINTVNDWYKNWYAGRMENPKFTDVATERYLAALNRSTPFTLEADPEFGENHNALLAVTYKPKVLDPANESKKNQIFINNAVSPDNGYNDYYNEKFIDPEYSGNYFIREGIHEKSHWDENNFRQPGTDPYWVDKDVVLKDILPKPKYNKNTSIYNENRTAENPHFFNTDFKGGLDEDSIDYLSLPTEIRARLNVWRQLNNIDPTKNYSVEELQKIMDQNIEDGYERNESDYRNIIELYHILQGDPELLKTLNDEFVQNDNSAGDQLNMAKNGGFLKTFKTGGSLPKPYSLPEDSFRQGARNLHNSIYASTPGQYPQPYENGGSLIANSAMPMVEPVQPNIIPASAFNAPIKFHPETYADIEKSDGTTYKKGLDGAWYISGPRAKDYRLLHDPAGIWADSLETGIRQAKVVPVSQIPIVDNSYKV